MKRYCRNCGKEIKEGDRFCSQCGWKVPDRMSAPNGSGDQANPQRSGKAKPEGRKWKAAAVILAVIILAAGGLGALYVLSGGFGENKKTLTVHFSCGDGLGEWDYKPEDQTVLSSAAASCPPYPTRDGYVFHGWYTDEACTEPFDFQTSLEADLVLYAGWLEADSEEAQLTEEEVREFDDCTGRLSEIWNTYADEDGYVADENQTSVLDEAEALAEEWKAQGTITYCSRQDRSIYMEFQSGLVYVYRIYDENTDSGDTQMVTPFRDSYSLPADDALEENCRNWFGESIRVLSDEDVLCSGGELASLGDCDVFLWHGHGGYVRELGSYLVSREKPFWGTALDYKWLGAENVFYNSMIKNKYLIISNAAGGQYYAVTPKYVRSYFPEMDDAIVFLAACQSGRTTELSSAFLDLGAAVVVCNLGRDDIDTVYDTGMVYSILKYMCGAGTDGVYHTIEEALQLAKEEWGQKGYDIAETSFQDGAVIEDGSGFFEDVLTYLDFSAVTEEDVHVDYHLGSDGSTAYTLWSGVSGTLVLSEESGKIPLETVVLTLTDQTGNVVGTARAEADGSFALNRLEGGSGSVYTLTAFSSSGAVLGTETALTIERHRCLDLGEWEIEAADMSAYAEIVSQYEAAHGAFELRMLSWCTYARGVNYLQLLDMDRDGTDEMLIGYMDAFQTDYTVEVWTCRNGEAVLLGEPEHYLIGVEGAAVCTAEIDGQPAVISGSNMSGYEAWIYDGEKILAAASYTETELQKLNLSILRINAGSTDKNDEEEQLRALWDQVRQTKEILGIGSEAEQAVTAYQFELLYNEDTGYYSCIGTGHTPRFEYVYIDEDDTPELVVALGGIHAEAAYLYRYDKTAGTAVYLGQFGGYGSFYYSERNNLIQQYDAHMGVIRYRFGRIENGAYAAIHDFSAEYADYSYEETPVLCRLDGQEITYEAYQRQLDAIMEGVSFTEAGYGTGTSIRDAMYDE